jgi:polyhydroxybutyrate depolymerase
MRAAALVALLAGCGSADPAAPDAGPVELPDQYRFGGDRPVYLEVPSTYDHAVPTPLVFLLHGYSANAFVQTRVLGFEGFAEAHGVLFVAPDGMPDDLGLQAWNATDACCGVGARDVDDVAYLGGLLDDIAAEWNVDRDRVYFAGHSNGGFMSYRMACERAADIAAIVSLAGASFDDPADCAPDAAVSVLQIHGDRDLTILYEGGAITYPSALGSVERWAGYAGCATELTAGIRRNLESNLDGNETRVDTMGACPDATGLELWTIEGGGHLPVVTEDFGDQVWAWMQAHPKS